MAKARPSITSPCVADRHHVGCERIAEFSTPSGKGGLIRVTESDAGGAIVEVYRVDAGVTVIAPADPLRDAAPDMLAALKDAESEIRRLHDLFGGDDRYAGKIGEPDLEIADAARAAIAKAESHKA